MFFFRKTIWRLLLRVSLKKDGLVLGLQKNFRTRSQEVELPKHQSGSSEVSFVTRALPIARKVAEDP